jgi:hypothetical protein
MFKKARLFGRGQLGARGVTYSATCRQVTNCFKGQHMTIKEYLRDVADKLLDFMYPALPVAITAPA